MAKFAKKLRSKEKFIKLVDEILNDQQELTNNGHIRSNEQV